MFWDNVAWVYDLFANGINRKANRALCEAVAQMIQSEDEALECACGTGLLSGVIATRCKSLIATDFSVNMLRRAERKYRNLPNIRFEPCDIMQLPYPDERFDVVIAANVIHLLDEPEKALQELSRVCRPGGRIILPTYMNRSGDAVVALALYYKITPDQILVVHDELDLPPGCMKIKQGGGNAGHNGLKDISAKLSTPNFWRLRLGTGHPRTLGMAQQVADFVLSAPSSEHEAAIEDCIGIALKEAGPLAEGDFTGVSRRLAKYGNPPKPPKKAAE